MALAQILALESINRLKLLVEDQDLVVRRAVNPILVESDSA